MKTKSKGFLAFVVGVAAIDYANRQFGQTFQDVQQRLTLNQAQQEAEVAYFKQSPEVVEWELGKLIPRLAIPTNPPYYPEDDRALQLLIAYARLVKVQKALGKQSQAEHNLEAVRKFARKLEPIYPANDGDTVAGLLSTFDKRLHSKE
jgi:hypothetical protein